jgi:hypothetical protein
MRTIQTQAIVADDRTVTLQLPPEVMPGRHHLVVVIDEPGQVTATAGNQVSFPRHDIPWPFPEDFTARREDLDDDSGRGA